MLNPWTKFKTFATWAQVLIVFAVVLLVVGLVVNGVTSLKHAIFGDPTQKAHAVEEYGWGQDISREKATGTEASSTAIKTYREHERISGVVQGGQNEVHRADKGQEMDPQIDGAIAVGLCSINASLCRVHDDGSQRPTGS
jgi:hypothetical protein